MYRVTILTLLFLFCSPDITEFGVLRDHSRIIVYSKALICETMDCLGVPAPERVVILRGYDLHKHGFWQDGYQLYYQERLGSTWRHVGFIPIWNSIDTLPRIVAAHIRRDTLIVTMYLTKDIEVDRWYSLRS